MSIRSSHDNPGVAAAVICIFLFPQMLGAAVSLPLNGYCKAGRFFPILVDREDASGPLTFSARGCITTTLGKSRQARLVIPMLATDTPEILTWQNGSMPLLTPKDNERLVGSNGDDVSSALPLFPGNRLIPVKLDAADLLPGPTAAWESLDGVLLNAELFQRVTDSQRSILLAGGVTLVAVGEKAPDARWPWRHEGSLWTLRCAPFGPMQLVDENAYTPTFSWQPCWSTTVRWQVMGAATLVVLITIALFIRQCRFTGVAAIGLLLLASAAFAEWHQVLGNIDRAGGDILVSQFGLMQRDQWVYERAKNFSYATIEWAGLTHPVFSSSAAMDQAMLQLNVLPSGETTFSYHALPDHTIAFVRRDVSVEELPTVLGEFQSPMQDLAKASYLRNADRIIGEIAGSKSRWGTVVIEHKQ